MLQYICFTYCVIYTTLNFCYGAEFACAAYAPRCAGGLMSYACQDKCDALFAECDPNYAVSGLNTLCASFPTCTAVSK